MSRFLARSVLGAVLPLGMVLPLAACSNKDEKKPAPPAVAPAEQKTPDPAPKPITRGHPFVTGPQMVFVPGKGVGPIRFGATVETIERHMQAPCDKKTAERCLYVRQAFEFFLKDGALVRVKSHRRDRKVADGPPGKDEYYGAVSGLLPPKIMMGLHRHVVIEEYGEPDQKTAIDPPGPDGLVDRHNYDGVILEYDRIENGNVVLGGIEIYPSTTAKPAGKQAGTKPSGAPGAPPKVTAPKDAAPKAGAPSALSPAAPSSAAP